MAFVTLKTTKPEDFEKFYPTSVMETGYDILKAWVSRMIMMGIYITGNVPFRDVLVHGLVNDPYGKKMSKSKGNVINPLELIDRYGADAIRFALVYGNATGNDQSLSYPKLEAARKFTNKLWNIGRYIDLICNNKEIKFFGPEMATFNSIDNPSDEKEWCNAVLQESTELIRTVTKDLDNYNFNYAAEKIYDYVWHKLADMYLEQSKGFIKNNNPDVIYVYGTLLDLFDRSLILFHPFMPFITEELYQRLRKKFKHPKESIMVGTWPRA